MYLRIKSVVVQSYNLKLLFAPVHKSCETTLVEQEVLFHFGWFTTQITSANDYWLIYLIYPW